MQLSVFLFASLASALPRGRGSGSSQTIHTSTSNTKWRPWSGTTTTHVSTLSHASSPHPNAGFVSHVPVAVPVSHIPSSSSGGGFNWGHAAIGAAAGAGAATLMNQHEQINHLQNQIDSGNVGMGGMRGPVVIGGAQPATVIAAQPVVQQVAPVDQQQVQVVPAGAVQQVPVVQQQPVSADAPSAPSNETAPIHSEKGQELILETDAGPKIFEQKN